MEPEGSSPCSQKPTTGPYMYIYIYIYEQLILERPVFLLKE
jgi:hypothetical protein